MKKVITICLLVIITLSGGMFLGAKTIKKNTRARSSMRTNKTSQSSKQNLSKGYLKVTLLNQTKLCPENYYNLYDFNESRVGKIPGQFTSELEDYWYFPNDDIEGNINFEISMPEDFPTDIVKKEVLDEADNVCNYLFSFLHGNDIYEANYKSKEFTYNSTESFINRWTNIFNNLSNKYHIGRDESSFLGVNLIFICNKIYEDSNYATYVFYSDYGFFRMAGNQGYNWNFITYNKSTGKEIKFSDLMFTNGKDVLMQNLLAAYRAEAKAKRVKPVKIKGSELLTEFNSVALVKGGILFHYPIYVLGAGYEGPYELFLPSKF